MELYEETVVSDETADTEAVAVDVTETVETEILEETVGETEETPASDEEITAHPETTSKIGFIAATLFVIAVIIAGVFVIRNTPMKRLVGVWDMKYNSATYMLSSDEQLFINGMCYGTYAATTDTLTIYLEAQDGEETPAPIVLNYTHDGDMLILEKPGDEDASMMFGFELQPDTPVVFTIVK